MDAIDKYAFAVRRLVILRDVHLDRAKKLPLLERQEEINTILQDYQTELSFLSHYFLHPKKTKPSLEEVEGDSLQVELRLFVPHSIFWLLNCLSKVRGELSLSGSDRQYLVKCKTEEALSEVRQIVYNDACSELVLLE